MDTNLSPHSFNTIKDFCRKITQSSSNGPFPSCRQSLSYLTPTFVDQRNSSLWNSTANLLTSSTIVAASYNYPLDTTKLPSPLGYPPPQPPLWPPPWIANTHSHSGLRAKFYTWVSPSHMNQVSFPSNPWVSCEPHPQLPLEWKYLPRCQITMKSKLTIYFIESTYCCTLSHHAIRSAPRPRTVHSMCFSTVLAHSTTKGFTHAIKLPWQQTYSRSINIHVLLHQA